MYYLLYLVLKLVFYLGWILCIYYGAMDAYVCLRNRAPLQMTCVEYVANKPSAKWLELAECYVDYTDVLTYYSTGAGGAGGTEILFVPVRPSESDDTPIQIIMEVTDPERTSLLQEFNKTTGDRVLPFVMAHQDELFAVETVTGLIDYGSLRARNKALYEAMAESDVAFADDCVILRAGEKPNVPRAVVLLGVGVIWGLLVIRRFVGKTKQEAVAEDELAEGSAAAAERGADDELNTGG